MVVDGRFDVPKRIEGHRYSRSGCIERRTSTGPIAASWRLEKRWTESSQYGGEVSL